MKIEAVIFDLGSVLATNEWPFTYEKIAQEVGTDATNVKEVLAPLFNKWCAHEINEAEVWENCEKQLTTKFSEEFKKDFWLKTYQLWSKDIEGTWKIAKELHEKKIRLALLSNTIEIHVIANEDMGRFQKLRDLGFEVFVFSYEEKMMKPDPRIYQVTLDKLAMTGEQCLMVDDKPNMAQGGTSLGIQGICFQSPEQLKDEFVGLGVL